MLAPNLSRHYPGSASLQTDTLCCAVDHAGFAQGSASYQLARKFYFHSVDETGHLVIRSMRSTRVLGYLTPQISRLILYSVAFRLRQTWYYIDKELHLSEMAPNHIPNELENQCPRLTQPVRITEQAWPEGAIPVVSISCFAYNHEKFIRECIDGFLMQKTTFPVEILIHDDASTDSTANIIREYEALYPHLIKPIYQTENQYSKNKNIDAIFNFARARGKYIALCDGDDYWTDPLKLQRQTEFLNSNPDYVLVAENSIWHDLSSGERTNFSELPERDIGILEMLSKRQFGTASVLFRNLEGRLQFDGVSGDTILWCHLAKYGKVKYKENVSSVYRRHAGGVTEGNKVEWAKTMIVWNNALRKNHPEVNNLVFKKRNLANFNDAINFLIKNKSYKQALFTIDELANLTDDPPAYKDELATFIEEELKRKDEQLKQIRNGWSYRIGRFITMPARGALKLLWNVMPKTIRNKKKLRKWGVVSIDKRKIINDIKHLKPLPPLGFGRTPKLIVSLTSFPQRIPEIFFSLYSLLNQTVKPDMLLLWLAEEQFPNKEKDLPQRVRDLQKYGLTIKWCSDIKSYKKLIPALGEFPDDIIVTADDDTYYPQNWLELLYESYLREPRFVHCHRAHRITFQETGEMNFYDSWPKCISTDEASYLNLFTGVGGVLYPPRSLYQDTSNVDLFMRLCPTADDVWFWAMAVLNETKIRVVDRNISEFIGVDPEMEHGLKDGLILYRINKNTNDDQIKCVLDFYRDRLLKCRLAIPR